MNELPIMNYERVAVQEGCGKVTSIGISGDMIVVGNDRGEIFLPSQSSTDVCCQSSAPVKDIAIAPPYFCWSHADGKVFIGSPMGSTEHAEIPISEYGDITSIAIAPDFSSSKRIVVSTTKCTDIVVVCKQGPPFPEISLSKTGGRETVVGLIWAASKNPNSEYLVWSQGGVKVMNTKTGKKISHIPFPSGDVHFHLVDACDIVILNNLDIIVASIMDDRCDIRVQISLDPQNFLPRNMTDIWWQSVMRGSGRNRIIGINIFDLSESSLILVSEDENGAIHHSVIDTDKGDIVVTDKVTITSTIANAIEAVYSPNPTRQGDAVLLSADGILHHIRKRTVADHCSWLMDRELYHEALRMSRMGDPELGLLITESALPSLISESKDFEKSIEWIRQMENPTVEQWSKWIDCFVSFPTGGTLTQSLRAVISIIPYPPRNGQFSLHQSDYDKIIDSLIRNNGGIDLLEILRRWPTSIYSCTKLSNLLVDIIDENFILTLSEKREFFVKGVVGFPSGITGNDKMTNTIALMLCQKILYDSLSQFDESLTILLKLRCMDELFLQLHDRLVQTESVREWFNINMQSLFQIEPVLSAKFVIQNSVFFPPKDIVSTLMEHRFVLHVFLRELFAVDPTATDAWQTLMVELYLDFDKNESFTLFLKTANEFDKEKALKLVSATRSSKSDTSSLSTLVESEAIILWKLGRPREAIDLLLEVSKDIRAAVSFAASIESTHDLWESINAKVRLNEQELLPGYLKTLMEMRLKSAVMLPRPDLILRQSLYPQSVPGLISTETSILRLESIRNEMEKSGFEILRNDWRNGRSGIFTSRNRRCVSTNIDTRKSVCRLCQSRVCCPPPGESIDDTPLASVDRLEDKIQNQFTSARSSLMVIISGNELVHSKCLLRTSVNFPT